MQNSNNQICKDTKDAENKTRMLKAANTRDFKAHQFKF